VRLSRFPDPAEVSEDAVYVADLVPEREDRQAAALEVSGEGRSGS
jgi:hypothetical protein